MKNFVVLIHKTVHVVESSLTSKAMERLLQAKRRLFLGNLFIAFIVKNVSLEIIGEFFCVWTKNYIV